MSVFESEVLRIVSRELGRMPESLRDDHRLREDLGADSIIALNILFSLERELSVQVKEEEIADVRTVGELRSLVRKLHSAA